MQQTTSMSKAGREPQEGKQVQQIRGLKSREKPDYKEVIVTLNGAVMSTGSKQTHAMVKVS